jgi:O-antigen/teichoic acid export membrane protein
LDRKSFWLYVARAVAAFSGIGVHFIFARIGGLSGYGVLSLFLNLNLLFNYLSDFGLTLNGPRLVAAGSYPPQTFAALQTFRISLGLMSAVLYVLVVLIWYADQSQWLLYGLPMIALYGFQADWLHRGMGRPDKAAYRQMAQSAGQLLLVALALYLGWALHWALLLYAAVAAMTFVASYPNKRVFALRMPANQLINGQLMVMGGMVAYFLTYNMLIPLLSRWHGDETAGFYASHYFLGTSLGTLSVITMEVFMAKTGVHARSYARWMLLFTGLALVGLALSPLYFNWLYGGKGFYWDATLTLLVAAIVGVHALRLYWVNSKLFNLNYRSFLKFNVAAFSLHVALLLGWLLLGKSYGPYQAASLLLIAETAALITHRLRNLKDGAYVG